MNFYDELPDNYKEIYSIDAGKKKTAIILNALAILLMVAVCVPLFFLRGLNTLNPKSLLVSSQFLISSIILLVCLLLYVVLHELTHGLFYKIFTHKKLTFGLKLSCAYCGVPQVYVKKIPMIITSLAPFVIYSIIFLVLLFSLPLGAYSLAALILFGVHFGGCVGDLYVSILMVFKFKGDILINDTGAKQTFYKKED